MSHLGRELLSSAMTADNLAEAAADISAGGANYIGLKIKVKSERHGWYLNDL